MKWILGLAVSLLLIGVAMWYKKSRWKVVAVASSEYSDEVKEQYNLLRSNGIRCKLEKITPKYEMPISNHPAGNFTSYTPPESNVQLLVHKKDMEQAQDVMNEK